MARHVYVILSNPVAGREDEYNDWYDNQHLADVIREAGFTACRRLRLSETEPPQDPAHRYLAMYEVETDDIDAVNARMLAAVGAGKIPLSPALDLSTIQMWYFEQITERSATS